MSYYHLIMTRNHRSRPKLHWTPIDNNTYHASSDDNFLLSPLTITLTPQGWQLRDDAKILALAETLRQAQLRAFIHAQTQPNFQRALAQGLLDRHIPSRKICRSTGMPRAPYSPRKANLSQ